MDRKLAMAALLSSVALAASAESFKTSDPAELREKSPATYSVTSDLKPANALQLIADLSRKCYERSGRLRTSVTTSGNSVEVAMSTTFTRTILSITDVAADGDGSTIKTYVPSDSSGFKTRADIVAQWLDGKRGCPGD